MNRELVLVPLDDLRPHPDNPKSHDLALLRASLGHFGYVEPIIEDARTGYLISGHGRRELLLDEREHGGDPPEGVESVKGQWRVPVVRGWASRSDSEARAVLVALNQIGPRGGWDPPALVAILESVAADDLLTLSGFSQTSFDQLVAKLTPPEDFPALDPDMETEYRCPRCAYEWSGQPAPAAKAEAAAE